MSTEITRMYASAADAAQAAAELREEGFDDLYLVSPPAAADVPLSAIAAQIAEGRVLLAEAKVYAHGVAAGRSLLTVHAPFGSGRLAETILDSHGPVDSGLAVPPEPSMWDEAAPLSSILGMPTVIDDPDPMSKVLGMPALSDNAFSLSGLFGIPLLTSGEMGDHGRFGLPYLSDNPTPLSSALGLPVLTKRQ